MGLAIRFFTTNTLKVTDGCILSVQIIHAVVGIVIITIYEKFVHPPITVSAFIYYCFLFCKYAIPPVLIITDVPFITGLSKVCPCISSVFIAFIAADP